MAAFGWNTYMWPPYVAWASSQHGGSQGHSPGASYKWRGRFLAVAIIGGRSPGKRGIQQRSGTSAQWSGIPRVTWLADTPLTRRTYFYKVSSVINAVRIFIWCSPLFFDFLVTREQGLVHQTQLTRTTSPRRFHLALGSGGIQRPLLCARVSGRMRVRLSLICLVSASAAPPAGQRLGFCSSPPYVRVVRVGDDRQA
ncbi:hypothetical protein J1605_005449 [Eschrichtius robustus]|uniref:Uncharacterized protein n=1 Tax=Eschrichtius robustus TaxID=9764 RepID=A0AB34HB77_ESCRO|nr:hypothetical protein J1605_005449 [Eschrichtius robustus]